MTEARWLTAADPRDMLQHLTWRGSERKLRRYCVEAVRPFIDCFFHPTSWATLAVAEEVAEGRGGEQEVVKARQEAWAAFPFPGLTTTHLQIVAARAAARTVEPDASKASEWTSNEIRSLFADREEEKFETDDEQYDAYFRGQAVGNSLLANLLRDIFGNPFRPVAVDPAWLTETAVGIARGIYEDRAFERMPILADALQDAGCEDAEVLSHCREPGTHVRGCWVVELMLGRSLAESEAVIPTKG